jgi:hypothetical protein
MARSAGSPTRPGMTASRWPISPHDLRHFYASALIRQGADPGVTAAGRLPCVTRVSRAWGHSPSQRPIRVRIGGGGSRADCKPGSVPPESGGGDHLSRAPVSRRLQRPLPEGSASSLIAPSYLVLLRAGFTWPAGHPAAGGLLPHHFTLAGARRRCLSVALSFGSPRLGVTQRPALWSPDFPPRPLAGTERSPVRLDPPGCYPVRGPFQSPRRWRGWRARRRPCCARAARASR